MFSFAKDRTPSYPALSRVTLTAGEWKTWSDKVFSYTANNVLDKFEKEGALENYRLTAKRKKGVHRGQPWYHGLIGECIRGISDLMVSRPDAAMDRRLDEIIDLIAEAIDEEGYLNPYVTLQYPERRWGRNGGSTLAYHETYNPGCLIEAGVHHYRATGKKKLLAVATKNANFLADFIGEAPKHNVGCEHSLIEEALVKLSELYAADPALCKELDGRPEEYMRLGRYLLENKGDTKSRWSYPQNMREYAQDVRPAREQRDAMGHAVRANLLYTGMAEVALHDRDEGLAEACRAIWKDIVTTKLHFNGCVGAERHQESYGFAYVLPNNAYLETCAGVALAFFGAGMFRISGEAKIWDTVENTLYNTLRAALGDTFDQFTYENPLISDGSRTRWSWHACPCCPPMLLKLTGMLPQLVFAQNGGELWLNLFINASLKGEDYGVSFADNVLSFRIPEGKKHLRLHLRIPEWAREFRLQKDGAELSYTVEKGYAVWEGEVSEGDRITLSYETPLVKYEAHPFVGADHGRVAVKHGPVLYCAERVDNPEFAFTFSREGGLRLREDGRIEADCTGSQVATLIPYSSWGNRSVGKMCVWIPQEGLRSVPEEARGWEELLYRPYVEYSVE